MKNNKTFFLAVIAVICFGFAEAQQFNVASYNVRNKNDGDAKQGNGWELRQPVITRLIQFHDFDLLGSQEVFKVQIDDMIKDLPGFNYIGVGRDDGKEKGEYSPIFYKTCKFRLLDSGTFWMSETTDRPNKGWDAALPRICTWGKFQLKETKQVFWVFNLHMDHRGIIARQESAKLVLEKIKTMSKNQPAILMGDFNVDQTNEAYHLLANSGVLKDVFETAKLVYALNGTFNNFDPNLVTDKRIDHIFVTNQFKAHRYGILTDSYRSNADNQPEISSSNFPSEATLKQSQARLPSDHFPVMTTLELKK